MRSSTTVLAKRARVRYRAGSGGWSWRRWRGVRRRWRRVRRGIGARGNRHVVPPRRGRRPWVTIPLARLYVPKRRYVPKQRSRAVGLPFFEALAARYQAEHQRTVLTSRVMRLTGDATRGDRARTTTRIPPHRRGCRNRRLRRPADSTALASHSATAAELLQPERLCPPPPQSPVRGVAEDLTVGPGSCAARILGFPGCVRETSVDPAGLPGGVRPFRSALGAAHAFFDDVPEVARPLH